MTCSNCGASPVACDNRRWLSGRPCCDSCDHQATDDLEQARTP